MKKRILHLLSSNQYSGAENVVLNIIKSLEQSYEFLYVSPDGSIREVLNEKKVNYIPLTDNNFASLNSIIKKWKPDIIHAHDFRASIKASFLPCHANKISHLHQNPTWIRTINIKSILYLLSCIKTDKIVTVSPEVLEEMCFKKIIKAKTHVLENHINTEAILKAANAKKLANPFDLAFVGRLTEVKDPSRFIRIVKKIKEVKRDIRAVIIGDGELRDECEKLINSYDLNHNVELMGFLANPFPILNNSKILVMTSIWEGFGLVAVEAMTLGKPVIAPPVGGLNTIITKESGSLCESDEDFIKKIRELLNNKDEYEQVSQGAKRNVQKYANKETWLNSVKFLYENLDGS